MICRERITTSAVDSPLRTDIPKRITGCIALKSRRATLLTRRTKRIGSGWRRTPRPRPIDTDDGGPQQSSCRTYKNEWHRCLYYETFNHNQIAPYEKQSSFVGNCSSVAVGCGSCHRRSADTSIPPRGGQSDC